MTRVALFCITVFAFAICAFAAIPAHQITSLPGYTGTFPAKQYSGYIQVDATNKRYLHYWLALSEHAPATDPVVLWLNGGPGCSSMDGLIYEDGPFMFVDDKLTATPERLAKLNAQDVPQVIDRPNRWNKLANMIYLESPAGVGYSYSDTQEDYHTNDNKTAEDNWMFLKEFFASYPEFAKNPFYISGESYAGIYIPTLAYTILEHNKAGDSNIPLKGVMVGNGCTGKDVGVCGPLSEKYRLQYMHEHGLFADNIWNQMVKVCDWTKPSSECYQLMTKAGNQIGNVNIYDIYGPCIVSEAQRVRRPNDFFSSSIQGPSWCVGAVTAAKWFNLDEVRKALHVADATKTSTWAVCSGRVRYDWSTPSVFPHYRALIAANVRVLIYNGDTDACVPYGDNEEWTVNMQLPIKEEWRPWNVNGQVAGFVTTYTNDFTFLTVKGSGHMVPQVRPETAYAMFERYLTNQKF